MNRRIVHRVAGGLAAVLLVLTTPGIASAQLGGTIAGMVEDEGGLVLPGVAVSARNVQTNQNSPRLLIVGLLLDVRHRGLTIDPELAIGDGGLGFWGALRKVFPQTREQRCWVHKTANVLNKLPKGVQPKAKTMLHDIWMAETQAAADHAFDLFVATFAAKFPAATTSW